MRCCWRIPRGRRKCNETGATMKFRPPGDCPNCSEEVPARAKVCHHCGATAEAGWNEPSGTEGLDLPDDDDFNYDEYLEKEFGRPNSKSARRRGVWIAVALLIVAALLWASWGWLFR